MVQFFQLPVSGRDRAQEMMGQGVGQGMGNFFQQQYQRGMLQKSLQQAKQAVQNPNATPMDKMFAFMEAGAGIPGSERYLGALLPLIQQQTQAEASQKAPFGMPQPGAQPEQPSEQQVKLDKDLGDFLQGAKGGQFYPSNVGAQQPPGNLPQQATSGIKQPVVSNQQLLKFAKPYAAQKTAAGVPTTPAEALEELKALNADNEKANQLVEEERKERVVSQREYGEIAANKLAKVFPGATDEETAYLKNKIEDLAGENKSEGNIERLAAREAAKYKDMVSNIEKDIPPNRLQNRIYQKLMGTEKSADSAIEDLKLKVKPLLDAGLYDRARNALANLGYFPEERERVVSSLGEQAHKSINQMPFIKQPAKFVGSKSKYGPGSVDESYTPEQKSMVEENLFQTLKNDPSANLILLRKEYEDKGVDWRLFKDSLNNVINSGQLNELNDDQFKHLNLLDQPPLNNLYKMFYHAGIIGR